MEEQEIKPVCGIVMPISAIDGCSESHWNDVMEIINDAIEEASFEPNLVSNADDVGVIQKRIIQNLYENPIVVCDVSGKNPNVMFELGLRLAFDKPTIIIKDDKTTYSFDTSPIEHLEYPRDLRFNKIEDFKAKLSDKIKKTFDKAQSDKEFSTFLKHFGEFKVAKIDQKEVTQQEYIVEEIRSLRSLILSNSKRPYSPSFKREILEEEGIVEVCCGQNSSKEKLDEILPSIKALPGVVSAVLRQRGPNHFHVKLHVLPDVNSMALKEEVRQLTRPGLARRKK